MRRTDQPAVGVRQSVLLLATAALACGCASPAVENRVAAIAASDVPRELDKVSHPVYRVAPPDILLIEAVRNIRRPQSRLEAGDVLTIRLGNPEPLIPVPPDANPLEQQFRLTAEAQSKIVDGDYRVQADGAVDLGPVYGKVPVEGLTVDEARRAIEEHLKRYTQDEKGRPAGIAHPQVSVSLADIAGKQAVAGEHLVRPDGSVSLGIYGSVYVAGMTLAEVKAAIEAHLAQFMNDPEVNVDVLAYNSQVYYVITDGGGFGEQVIRLPCTGNETVLDAISQIEGLSQVSSKKIWVARPSPPGMQCAQVLDVHWSEITKEGLTTTNYQLLPGDRIYIQADHMISFDNFVAKVVSPFERIAGFILLGHGTVRALQFGHQRGGGFGGFGGFGGAGF